MSAETGESDRYHELVASAIQAQWDERYQEGIEGFAEAILVKCGVEPPQGYENYKLPSSFGRKTGYVTEVAELAIPKEVFGWDVQRVRVDRLKVGRKMQLPGLHITEQYRLGSVTAISVETEGERKMKVRKHGLVDEVEFRNVGTKQDVCSVMNLAVHKGTVVQPNRIGRKTVREHLQTAGSYLGYIITEVLTAESEEDD